MTKERNVSLNHDEHITSAGVRLSDVPDFARSDVEWMEGVHGSAKDGLPSERNVPTPKILNSIPELHPDRYVPDFLLNGYVLYDQYHP